MPTRRRFFGRVGITSSVLLCLLLATCAFGAGSASADQFKWTGSVLDTTGTGFGLSAVICPTATQCTTVTGNGQEVTFNPTSPGSTIPVTVDSGAGLNDLACPSATQCTAVDNNGKEVTFNPTSPAPVTSGTIEAGAGLGAVDCSSTSQCVATDQNGNEVTFNPTSPGGAAVHAIDAANGDLSDISCRPSGTQCTAVDFTGFEVTFDPTTGTVNGAGLVHVDTTTGLSTVACPADNQCTAIDFNGAEVTFNPQTGTVTNGPTQLQSTGSFGFTPEVSCPTTTQCTALGFFGNEITFNPQAPAAGTSTTIDPNGFQNGISCPTASQCTSVDSGGGEATFNPGSPSTASFATLDTGTFLNDVACPAESQCTTVDNNHHEVTFNPGSPGTPTPVNVDRSTSLGSLDCPSTTQCTGMDFSGREVTFNPATGAVTNTELIDGNNGPNDIACPSTTQCTAVDGNGNAVTFNPQSPGSAKLAAIDQQTCGASCTLGTPTFGGNLTSVSCPSTSQCTAVDNNSGNGSTQPSNEFTFNPQALPSSPSAGTPIETATACPPGSAAGCTFIPGLNDVACPAATQCTAVDQIGREVTFNPQAPPSTPPSPVDIDGTNGLNNIACPSATQCTTVDGLGNEITLNPQSPGTATPVPIANANSLTAVACSSTTLCVAVDSVGNGFAGFTVPVNTGLPTISGPTVEQVGATPILTVTQGTWTGSDLTFKYQWLRCDSAGNNCAAIASATGKSYTLTSADLNHTIRVTETATNPAGSASVNSAQTPLVTLRPIGSLVLKSTKLKVSKGKVAVPFLCNSYLECDGNFSITLRVKSAKTHHLVTIVCTKSSKTFFRIKAGKRKTLKVPVLKGCVAQLKAAKHHTVKGKLSSRPRTGQKGVIRKVKLHT